MSLSNIRTAIKTALEAVSNIGTVHDYARHTAKWEDLLVLFRQADGKFKGVMFWRRKTEEEALPSDQDFNTHEFQIEMLYALDDSAASGKTFEDLVEAVRDKFRSDKRAGTGVAAVSTVTNQGPVQVEDQGHAMLSAVFCHVARLSLQVEEEL